MNPFFKPMKVSETAYAALLNKKLAEIVTENPGAAEVLKTLGISVKEDEEATLIQAAATLKLDENEVLQSLVNLNRNKELCVPVKIQTWPVPLLMQFIQREYHKYELSLLEDALAFEKRVTELFGDAYPETNQIHWYLDSLKEKMVFHFKFQEEKFFPSIRTFLSTSVSTDGKVRSMEKQVQLVQKDQEEMQYLLAKIAEISNNFTPPVEDSPAFDVFYSRLKEMHADLQTHHFVENEYLISAVNKALIVAKS